MQSYHHQIWREILKLDQYNYPQNYQQALNLIKEAVEGEKEDEVFYNQLIGLAPNDEARKIIKEIRDDETKHIKLFRIIYFNLTNQELPLPPTPKEKFNLDYHVGIKKALLGELEAVEKYRLILFAMQERTYFNILIDIITDEINHGILFNLLLNLYDD